MCTGLPDSGASRSGALPGKPSMMLAGITPLSIAVEPGFGCGTLRCHLKVFNLRLTKTFELVGGDEPNGMPSVQTAH
jgi:hypothetical protein